MFRKRFKILWIFLVAVSVGATPATKKATRNIRIMNGEEITVDQAPYIVAIRARGSLAHICGGTLITERFVITAAHCFEVYVKEQCYVIGDASAQAEKGERRFIEKLSIHPEYNPITNDKDVAVIKLDRDMTGKFVQPIKLCDRHLGETDYLQVSGWGLTKEQNLHDTEKTSPHLRTVRLKVQPQTDCVQQYINVNETITDNMVCAAEKNSKDACTGDSGGPGITDKALCAVVSFGKGCGRSDYPGVFVRIDAVRDFIDESLRN